MSEFEFQALYMTGRSALFRSMTNMVVSHASKHLSVSWNSRDATLKSSARNIKCGDIGEASSD